ncbi:MAG: hypothetical protein HZB30_04155 [Nitrospirae bacterium]|nr:hypothetical protein [Nitrospirota bacterium]
MKTRGEIAKKGLYVGAGAGLVLFALIGLLPGSFIGGVIGLNIAGSIFGYPVGPQIAARMIVAAAMLCGILVSGIVFTAGLAFIGWAIGYAIDSLMAKKPVEEEVRIK